jgi:hypothetical protein
MPKDEVKARLAPIPVYTVANPKNEFVLVAGEVRASSFGANLWGIYADGVTYSGVLHAAAAHVGRVLYSAQQCLQVLCCSRDLLKGQLRQNEVQQA